jgi:hypothetical protein
LLKGIPYPDGYFDVVYHNNVLEHFQKNDAIKLIEESFRVLKKGGVTRVVVPDLENIARSYLLYLDQALQGNRMAELNYDWMMLELYDQVVRTSVGGEMLRYLTRDELPNKEFIYERCGNVVKDIRMSNDAQGVTAINKGKITWSYFLNGIRYGLTSLLGKSFSIGQFRIKGEIHQWMYDRFSLGRLLTNAGFEDIQITSPLKSIIPDWNRYALDAKDGEIHAPTALYVEAIKH